MFENVKAVLFDLDNTLIVRRLALQKLAHYVNRFYFRNRADEHDEIAGIFCECFKSGYDDLRVCFENFTIKTSFPQAVDYKEFKTMWDFYYPFCTCADPNVKAVLELKNKGYRIGILTNGTAVLQQGKVDVVGFRDWFEFVIATREIGPDKPDLFSFRYVMDMMKLTSDDIVYVGDHSRNDIDAPRRVGMRTVWYGAYMDWDPAYERADAEIFSLTELPGLFPAL